MFLKRAWYCFVTCTVSSIHCCFKKKLNGNNEDTNEVILFGDY